MSEQNQLEEFVPENLRPVERYIPPMLRMADGVLSQRFTVSALSFFALGLIALWALGYVLPPGDWDAVAIARRHIGERSPVGTQIRSMDNDPIGYIEPELLVCHFFVQPPGEKERYVGVTMKRKGRWWRVDY